MSEGILEPIHIMNLAGSVQQIRGVCGLAISSEQHVAKVIPDALNKCLCVYGYLGGHQYLMFLFDETDTRPMVR